MRTQGMRIRIAGVAGGSFSSSQGGVQDPRRAGAAKIYGEHESFRSQKIASEGRKANAPLMGGEEDSSYLHIRGEKKERERKRETL